MDGHTLETLRDWLLLQHAGYTRRRHQADYHRPTSKSVLRDPTSAHLPEAPPPKDLPVELSNGCSPPTSRFPRSAACPGSPYFPGSVVAHLARRGMGLEVWGPETRGALMARCLPNTVTEVVDAHEGQVFCGQYSVDGSMFWTACQDGMIRVYDAVPGPAVATGNEAPSYAKRKEVDAKTVGWAILDTDLSFDKRFMIYSSWSNFVHMFSVDGDHEATFDFSPTSHHFCLFSVKWSPQGDEIVGGSSDHALHVYDVEVQRRTARIPGHDNDVNTVCWLEDNSQVVISGSDDHLVKVWDRRSLKNTEPGQNLQLPSVGVLEGHAHGVTHVSSRQDGRFIISNSKDQSIKLWDLRKMTSTVSRSPRAPQMRPHRSEWDYRYSSRLPQTSPNDTDVSLMTYRGHKVFKTLIRSYFSPAHTTGQRYIYSGSSDGKICMYDVLTGSLVQRLCGHRQCVRDVSMNPYDQTMISTGWDHQVLMWKHSPPGEKGVPVRTVVEPETGSATQRSYPL